MPVGYGSGDGYGLGYETVGLPKPDPSRLEIAAMLLAGELASGFAGEASKEDCAVWAYSMADELIRQGGVNG